MKIIKSFQTKQLTKLTLIESRRTILQATSSFSLTIRDKNNDNLNLTSTQYVFSNAQSRFLQGFDTAM
ncbi:hypothetical protein BC643_2693 [Mangrovibacterium diazotrophicum]|uniref:Uncharacterized protein n=1 Tax=Mangrovibacterium diazotrophicum TaxID=1261403 RepID=A0A419WA91_9BACT|nr:hypothetical protein BC643_2693 [Mangrovibacterium diazotrophicum]